MGVFDPDELDIPHFRILPLEGDTPRRFSGVRIDGVFGAALEFVVVEERGKKEGFFIRLVEHGEAFECLEGVESAEFSGFLAAQFPSEKNCFGDGVGEALDHRE